MCLCLSTKAKQQARNRAAPPEHAEEEWQKPERGLTLRLIGGLQRSSELNRRLGVNAQDCEGFSGARLQP